MEVSTKGSIVNIFQNPADIVFMFFQTAFGFCAVTPFLADAFYMTCSICCFFLVQHKMNNKAPFS